MPKFDVVQFEIWTSKHFVIKTKVGGSPWHGHLTMVTQSKTSVFGPVLLGLTNVAEDLPSSSWVC